MTEHRISDRFRGFLPVVIDVETGGFVAEKDAVLEEGATTVRMDENGLLSTHRTFNFHVTPFEGANIEQSALDFTGIDPYHPFREAVTEAQALGELFNVVRKIDFGLVKVAPGADSPAIDTRRGRASR